MYIFWSYAFVTRWFFIIIIVDKRKIVGYYKINFYGSYYLLRSWSRKRSNSILFMCIVYVYVLD